MGYELSGYDISGYELKGAQDMLSIGEVIFTHDYRFNVQRTPGETDRIEFWGDLGPNAVDLSAASFRRFYDATDGFGDGGNAVTVQMTSPWRPILKALHDGTAFVYYAVVNFPAAPDALNRLFITSLGTSMPGMAAEIVNSTGVFRCVVQNDSDTGIINNSTSAIPFNEFIFLARVYYGSGTGSNNAKSILKNAVTNFTANPTFGTGNGDKFLVGKNSAGSGDNYRIKRHGAYRLAGKSINDINAFFNLMTTVLKQDSEYSSLVVPTL